MLPTSPYSPYPLANIEYPLVNWSFDENEAYDRMHEAFDEFLEMEISPAVLSKYFHVNLTLWWASDVIENISLDLIRLACEYNADHKIRIKILSGAYSICDSTKSFVAEYNKALTNDGVSLLAQDINGILLENGVDAMIGKLSRSILNMKPSPIPISLLCDSIISNLHSQLPSSNIKNYAINRFKYLIECYKSCGDRFFEIFYHNKDFMLWEDSEHFVHLNIQNPFIEIKKMEIKSW